MRIALPKGRLLAGTSELLQRSGWGLDGYQERARLYRLTSSRFTDMSAKMFHEKDVPIQVSVGNYDLGICSRDWANELLVKFPRSAFVIVSELGYGPGAVYACSSSSSDIMSLDALYGAERNIRIAGEYPNLAEALAEDLRLRHFSIFPLWGGAPAYPPDSAELALVYAANESELAAKGLRPLSQITDCRAVLIANKHSLAATDMTKEFGSVVMETPTSVAEPVTAPSMAAAATAPVSISDSAIKLALPDGHQQPHVKSILDKAGIAIEDYPSVSGGFRPSIGLPDFAVKIIRPQDMPAQVACSNFDLAITGRDWLTDHLLQFPGSPIRELLDLKYGKVRLVAVVANDVPVSAADGLATYFEGRDVRIASEYTNITDDYARRLRLGRYRIIPTWGATEAFLPEDADMLIENTETGGTIARHNLKIVDTLFESTACLIGRADLGPSKQARAEELVRLLTKGLEAAGATG